VVFGRNYLLCGADYKNTKGIPQGPLLGAKDGRTKAQDARRGPGVGSCIPAPQRRVTISYGLPGLLLLLVDFLLLKVGGVIDMPDMEKMFCYLKEIIYPHGSPATLDELQRIHRSLVGERSYYLTNMFRSSSTRAKHTTCISLNINRILYRSLHFDLPLAQSLLN